MSDFYLNGLMSKTNAIVEFSKSLGECLFQTSFVVLRRRLGCSYNLIIFDDYTALLSLISLGRPLIARVRYIA